MNIDYKNKPMLFSKDEIPKIKEELDSEIPKIIEEFNMYVKTSNPIDIKYKIEESTKGFSCSGDLYLGEQHIRHYRDIDLLIYDLYNIELSILLKEMNKCLNNKNEIDEIVQNIENENDEEMVE